MFKSFVCNELIIFVFVVDLLIFFLFFIDLGLGLYVLWVKGCVEGFGYFLNDWGEFGGKDGEWKELFGLRVEEWDGEGVEDWYGDEMDGVGWRVVVCEIIVCGIFVIFYLLVWCIWEVNEMGLWFWLLDLGMLVWYLRL